MQGRHVNTPTVLVLGAGASYPYGFPLGTGLYNEVLQFAMGAKNQFMQKVLGPHSHERLQKFLNALGSSGWESVDAFLDSRKDLLDIGKKAIASVIMDAEMKSKGHLFTADAKDEHGVQRGKWYKHFRSSLSFDPKKFENHKLSVITFNYDRSFEYFLHCAMKYSFDLRDDDAAEALSSVPIIHMHGQLGKLPWEDRENGREYGSKVDAGSIRKYANDILIMSEEITDRDKYKHAQEILREAKIIYFLGFGYADINLQRITKDIRNSNYIAGTAIGFSDLERKQIENRLSGRAGWVQSFIKARKHWPRTQEQRESEIGIHLAPPDMTIARFLRSYVEFI